MIIEKIFARLYKTYDYPFLRSDDKIAVMKEAERTEYYRQCRELMENRAFVQEMQELVKTYYVGDATQDNMGTYMLLEDSDEPFIMNIPGFRGFLNTRYSTLENDWRNHSIYNLEIPQIKSVKLEFPSNPEKSFFINNIAKNKFTLTSLSNNQIISNYDTLKLFDYLTSFRNVKFEYIIPKNKDFNQDSVLASTPFHIITLTEMSGKINVLKTYHKKANSEETELDGTQSLYDKDRLYASINNEKDFVLIQFYVFDNILRPLSYFINTSDLKKTKLK